MSEPQKNKPWKEDYPTGKPMKYVVTIMGPLPHGEGPEGTTVIGGAVVGPFDSREESLEFVHWLESEYPGVAAKSIMGSAQILEPEDFKQAVADAAKRKQLNDSGWLHS